MENSSQVGILMIMRSHKKVKDVLPSEIIHNNKKERNEILWDKTSAVMDPHFFNVSPVRMYLEKEYEAFVRSLEHFEKQQLGHLYENKHVGEGDKNSVYCNSKTDLLVGEIYFSNATHANALVDTAFDAYSRGNWCKAHPVARASVLLHAAVIMLQRRLELAALIIYESGKSPLEALGDVDEAIDFINFYAREEVSIHVKAEQVHNRGVVAVIAPWNFPLAIPCVELELTGPTYQ